MPYLGNTPAEKYSSYSVQHFTTSATTSYTLDFPVANENEIELFINNVRQEPGSSYAYTASGTALTLSAATSASDTMYCVFQGKATQTVAPATGSVTNAMLSGSIESSKLAFASYPYRNLIINGDMSIAQRGTSSSSLSGYTSCDRFTATNNNLDQLAGTLSQISDAPSGSGLSKSFKFTVTTPETTLEADEYQTIQHRIEGQNLQHLKYNTSSAESLTLSFWVKSSVTGTYAIGLYLIDNNRNIGTTYTINSANTWEKKTLTFVGDTSGSIGNDNTEGLRLWFILGAGSTFNNSDNTSWDTYSSGRLGYGTSNNLLTTSSATWQITGVQLEVGTSASDFEFLPYDVNLQRCMRYYEKIDYPSGGGDMIMGAAQSTQYLQCYQPFLEIKRTTPTVQVPTPSDFRVNDWRGHDEQCNGVLVSTPYTRSVNILFSKSTHNLTQGYGGYMNRQQNEPYITVDAEL